MTREFMQKLLDSGEGFTIEYKKNENKLSSDVFETISSFSNRYGGHVLLGSGMRNLYKYTKLYAHAEPILTEGDVFRIVIPFSSNALASSNEANVKLIDANHEANSEANIEANSQELYDRILEKAESNPHITQKELADDLGVSRSTVQRAMDDLKDQKRLERIDGTRGYWKVNSF